MRLRGRVELYSQYKLKVVHCSTMVRGTTRPAKLVDTMQGVRLFLVGLVSAVVSQPSPHLRTFVEHANNIETIAICVGGGMDVVVIYYCSLRCCCTCSVNGSHLLRMFIVVNRIIITKIEVGKK